MKEKITSAIFTLSESQSENEKGFQIFPAGSFRAADGRPKEVEAWFFGETLQEQLKQKKNPIVIDYEHQSLNTIQNGLPAPAAGWAKEFQATDEGLFVVNPEWTEKARMMIDSGEYRFISPVFSYSLETGEITELYSIALTNTPAIDGMQPVALKQFIKQQGQSSMDKLKQLLGLAEDASDDDVMKAVETLLKKLKEVEGVEATTSKLKELLASDDLISAVTALKVKAETPTYDPAKFVPVTTFRELLQDNAAMSSRLKTIEQERDKEKVEALIRENPDKLFYEQQIAYARTLSPENLQKHLDASPSLSALKQSQTAGKAPTGTTVSKLTPEELAVCKQLKLTEEDFLKSKEGV